MDNQAYHLDKRRVRNSFDRAAASYDGVAVLQREIGARLLERLDYIRLQPASVIDVGAGTGHLSKTLAQRYKEARVIALDLAPNMLRTARRHAGLLARWRGRQGFVCGDAERLPFANHSADLLFSNVTLQWCNNLDAVFNEFRRVLKPGGLLLFSTFGPDTLKELRTAWAHADSAQHVSAFIDMHDVGDALQRAAFADPVMDAERLTLTYSDVRQLMRELKSLGARNAAAGRTRGLTGKGRLRAMADAYEHERRDGVLPATFEVVYGLAWAPSSAVNLREDGVVRVAVDSLRRRASPR
ncbi:MAG: malonyl-ACP O-methyltransferase BioC [Pseudomonadota bacterium]